MDVDAKSQQPKDPHNVLEVHVREKKYKYLEACLEQRWHFSPFVASTDVLLGKESQILLKKLSALLLAEKWEKPYSEICDYDNARMVQATHLYLQGSRIPTSQMSNRLAQWEVLDKHRLYIITTWHS
jgi:hypothetical protein